MPDMSGFAIDLPRSPLGKDRLWCDAEAQRYALQPADPATGPTEITRGMRDAAGVAVKCSF